MNLSVEDLQILHLLAKRKNPHYHFTKDLQFISLVIFLKRNTAQCLICNKEILNEYTVIVEHGFNHLKEYNLVALI